MADMSSSSIPGSGPEQRPSTPAAGPLVVSSRNRRCFTPMTGQRAGRAVCLTGSHIWNNLHDGMGPGAEAPDEPERLDFDAYLRFLTDRGHNFIRLWRLGADPFAGGRRRLPPQHDAAALGAYRAGRGQGRSAAVRPRTVGTCLLRAAAGEGDRRRGAAAAGRRTVDRNGRTS